MNQQPEKTYYVFQVQENDGIVYKVTNVHKLIDLVYRNELIEGSIQKIRAPNAIGALAKLGFTQEAAIDIILRMGDYLNDHTKQVLSP